MGKRRLLLLVILLTLGADVATCGAATGLMGYWPFDGDALDASGNGHDGQIGGAPTFAEGRIGQAMKLDGANDWVLVGDWDPSAETGQLTVALWVNWDETNLQNNMFVTKRSTWDEAGLAWQFIGKNDGSALFRNLPTTLRGGAGPGGEWVHWAATFDGEMAAIYKNGELVAGPTAFEFTGGANSPISIGARSDLMNENLKGLIDEVRIYNRALPVEEIVELDPPKLQAHTPSPANGDITVTMALLTWTPGDTATLHEVYLGTDPNLGPDDLVQPRSPVALYFHGPGITPGTTYYWRVDEIEANMTTVHTGNVWSFLAQPLTAYLPDPADGMNEASLDPNATLTWAAAQGAARHHVYFSDVYADVEAAAAGADRGEQTELVFAPGPLEPLTAYYWRVDEIGITGEAQPGDIWSLTTFAGVDDFESYTDDMEAGEAIFQVWIDGIENGTTSYVGYEVSANSTFGETTIVHDGGQSMPLDYNNVNAPYYAEASRTWIAAQNWTAGDAETLVLYVRGNWANTAEPLYVALEDSRSRVGVVVHGEAQVATTSAWTRWAIPLSEFEAAGVDVTAVKTMHIGLGDRDNPAPGGAGLIFIDDIRLTRPGGTPSDDAVDQ